MLLQQAEYAVAGVGGTLSGTVGTVVFSHNTYGPYSYTKPARTNPNTGPQQRIRGWLSLMSSVWPQFSQSYRDAWATFADNTRSRNAVGSSCRLSGFNCYIAAATFRFYNGITGAISAPTVFSTARLTPPAYVPIGYPYCRIDFALQDPWRHQSQAGYAVYASRPQPVTVNHFTGPFQFVLVTQGNPMSPPVGAAINLLYIPDAARPIVYFRARLLEEDNRLSSPFITRVQFP